jgi:glycosyltransferase involved in cell wall biosynthesis
MDQVEFIVVANGCVDGTKWYLDRLKYLFDSLGFEDHFKIVWSDAPLGFSKAVNAGINESSGERVILLNILSCFCRHCWL